MNNIYSNSLLSLLTSKFSAKFRLLLMCFFVNLIPLFSFGQSTFIDSTPGTGKSWTVPAGVTTITVQIWGAGGAGGGSQNNNRGGGGGGAGGYSTRVIPVVAGQTIMYSIGAGGAGSINNGTAGTKTELFHVPSATAMTANGGGFGTQNNGATVGGAGGNATGGTTNTAGTGGLAGSASGGKGGDAPGSGGTGGAGRTSDNGDPGGVPGGGGGGGEADRFWLLWWWTTIDNDGGNGGNGQVRVSWTCPATAGTLSGNQYLCSHSSNQTTTFSSTVTGGTWSSSNTAIATVNPTTGVVTAVATGTTTITYTIASSGCTTRTVTRDVYVANGPGGGVTAITGSNLQCQNSTTTYAITSNAVNYSHTWSYTGTGVTFMVSADTRSAIAIFGPNATSGNVTVHSTNACGTNYGINLNVQVGALPTAGTILGTTSVCVGASEPRITFTNPQNFGVIINYNINGGTTQNIYINANSTSNLGVSTASAGTFTYNLVSIENGVGFSSCSSPISGSAIVTVSNAPVAPSGITGTNSICNGSSTTLTLTGGTAAGVTAQWYSGSCGGTLVGTGNSITVSPTTTTTYYVRYEGGCNTTGCASRTVTVNSSPVITIQPSTPTVTCFGSGSQSMTVAATGTALTYDWKLGGVSVVNGGVISGQGTATLTLTNPTTANAGNYTVLVSGTCTPAVTSDAAIVTVNPIPATPIFGTITNANCVISTGSIVLNGLPSGSWTINQIGTVPRSYTGNTPSFEVTGLAVGNYTFTVSNTNGCPSLATASQAIISDPSTTWNGSAWSSGVPTILKAIIFDGDFTSTTDVEGCSCTVNAGKNVVFKSVLPNSGHTLKITNEVKILGTGTLTFENNASLVQTSTTATNNNIGKIYYKRHTTAVRRYDFTYWSSPVTPQTLYNLSPNTLSDKYFGFNSDANDWVLSYGGGAPMEPANGYSIRAPQTSDIVTPAIDTNPTFFGVPNNGNYTVSSTATAVNNKSYLLGNPYPSALDADAFLEANKTVLDGTLYFWTHNSNVTAVGAFYEYSDNDYATYNLTGGTGVDGPYPKGGVAAPNTGVNNSIPLGKIAAGQGFFATGIATGPINFTNAMRVGVGSITGDNSQFFRTTKTKAKTTTAIEKNRVWLNLYNTKGAFKQALIGYVTGATNAYDSGYDGESFDGNEFVDFYSVTPENYLVIQGRALPFDETDTVPLGYRSKEEMNLNISIDQTDGVLATQNIYIEDKLLNVIHNIKDTPYAFTTEAGTFDDRFVLRYTDKTLGTGDFNPLSNQIIISKDKNELKIKSELETIKRVTVFDLLGRKVFEKDTEDSNEFRSSGVSLSKQIGVVKVTLTNGKVISKKVRF